MKKYDIFDITKVILCVMIVAIHTNLLPKLLYPWLRLAVPLFFIISSFLLSTKINNSPSSKQKDIIKIYILRLIKLYIFWFVVLLPITIYVRRDWFNNGLYIGLLNIIIKPMISSTFLASWYLSASIIGTIIVHNIYNKVNYKVLIVLFSMIYLICCLTSSYSFLYENNNSIKSIFNILTFIQPHFSFLVSLIFILFGIIISKNLIIINKKIKPLLLVLSIIMLYIEWIVIFNINKTYNNDCYIFLMPTAILIFSSIKDIKIKVKNNRLLRQFSSFVYPLHASVAIINQKILEMIINNELLVGIINFVTTISICLICFLITKKAEKKIEILKNSY